ncbi:MAG: hypothetical protein R3B09_34105 [Nannocystaceae bacterium]
MSRACLVSAALGLALGLLSSPRAHADVGPPDKSCTAERRCVEGGVECHYLNSEPLAEDIACEEDAKRRGLTRVCQRGGGTVGYTVFCPKDKIRSSACSVDPAAGGPGALAILAFGVVAVRVRRGRGRT